MKKIFICTILIIVAFVIGYGWGYIRLRNAEKEWAAAKGEMQSRISKLETDLARAKVRESLREMSETLTQISTHLSEKNYGLAVKTADGLKEAFGALQPNLDEEWKAKFNFFPPALEEIKKEAENVNLNARKKTEEIQNLFEQALKPAKKN